MARKDRDIEKTYTVKQTVAKLRRLADCLEQGKPYRIQIAGERINVPARRAAKFKAGRELKNAVR